MKFMHVFADHNSGSYHHLYIVLPQNVNLYQSQSIHVKTMNVTMEIIK